MADLNENEAFVDEKTTVDEVQQNQEEALAREVPVEEAPVDEVPEEEAPAEETPVEEAPIEAPIEAVHIEAAPIEAAPVEEAPEREIPVVAVPPVQSDENSSTAEENIADKANELLKELREEREQLERDKADLRYEKKELEYRQKAAINSAYITGVGTFFRLHFLFNIPIIGIIASIIFSFAGSNISRKNYARARLIWQLLTIFLILLVAVAALLLFKKFGSEVEDLLSDFVKKLQ